MPSRTAIQRLILLVALPIAFLAGHYSAFAENGCPNGYEPWQIPVQSNSDCMAIPDYGRDAPPDAPAPSEPVWTSRWGAIAIGSTASGDGTGFSTNMTNKNAAEKAAIKRCLDANGGETCRSKVLSYHDQCAVIAWGVGSYSVWSAATISEASALAIEECGKLTEDCRIYYSNCSYPVRIR